MISFCTLYNINYADKGLVLYDSLLSTGCDFKLYVLAMDKELEKVLSSEQLERLEVIPLENVLEYDPRLKEIQNTRTSTEFCWTCGSVIIDYVLKKYSPDICTYIDADMFFYSDPTYLIDSLNKPVGIMKHRYPKDKYYRLLNEYSGTYCVEFNPFRNDENGLKVLFDWKEDCIKSCDERNTETGLGDQGYLDLWEERYPGKIYIYDDPAAGIASWNIKDYSSENGQILYKNSPVNPVFYHFSGIRYSSDNSVTITANVDNPDIINYFYEEYLHLLEGKRNYLSEKYDIDLREKTAPASVSKQKSDRELFLEEMSDLIKHFKFISVIKKVLERKYISNYCSKFKTVTFKL